MKTGAVKWFNARKGYGFIEVESETDEKDVFVHITAVKEAGVDSLEDGQRVEFEMIESNGKQTAGNLKLL